MSDNSSLFDNIRIKPRGKKTAQTDTLTCEFPGCSAPATHKAPKGRQYEGTYWHFCVNHVREYNASYNYFDGMSDDAVQAYQKDSMIGHRPTWAMGTAKTDKNNEFSASERDWAYSDPLGILRDAQLNVEQNRRHTQEPKHRVVPATVRRALEALDLDEKADAETIRITYKTLVKKFHPDSHGGDRAFEDRLREIIKAHATLKAAGFC